MKIFLYLFCCFVCIKEIFSSKKYFFKEIYIEENLIQTINENKEKISLEYCNDNEFLWKFHFKTNNRISIYQFLVKLHEFDNQLITIKNKIFNNFIIENDDINDSIPEKNIVNEKIYEDIIKIKKNYKEFISSFRKKLINIFLKNNLLVSLREENENIFLEKICENIYFQEYIWYFYYFLKEGIYTCKKINIIYDKDNFIVTKKEIKNSFKEKIDNMTYKKYEECLFNKYNYKNFITECEILSSLNFYSYNIFKILNDNNEKVFLEKINKEEYIWYFYYFKENNINVIKKYVLLKENQIFVEGKETQIFHLDISSEKILSNLENNTYKEYSSYIKNKKIYDFFHPKDYKRFAI
jgi:hypothetical protein